MSNAPHWPRRHALQVLGAAALSGLDVVGGFGGAKVWALPAKTLNFPRDAGAHPDFRTEWWYVTGYVNAAGNSVNSGSSGSSGNASAEAAYGFQVTFFRSRVEVTQKLKSSLAAKQLIFAHAAITDVKGKKLWHDQRIARWSGAAPGSNPVDTASASTTDTSITLKDWSLQREGADLRARIPAGEFALDLTLTSTQPVLLQGKHGLSRKGPEPKQASYYYSVPQLQVKGSLQIQGRNNSVESGSRAWLDHEWSQELLHPSAVGWDWIGINLFDGSALTAFRLRNKAGEALWDGGSFRSGNQLFTFSQGEVIFKPLRSWKSAKSRASYPVEWMVRTPADYYTVRALVDDQELDSSQSTGAIYWEGLCEVWNSNDQKVGRGYLEMTGYAKALRL